MKKCIACGNPLSAHPIPENADPKDYTGLPQRIYLPGCKGCEG